MYEPPIDKGSRCLIHFLAVGENVFLYVDMFRLFPTAALMIKVKEGNMNYLRIC